MVSFTFYTILERLVTISEWCASNNTQMKVFDMGRRIEEIPTDLFFEIEQQKQAYPTPYLKHAWLGIVTWHKQQPGKHHIWFVKLPLDERNLLELDPRNAFLRYWQQVVNMPDQEHGEAPFNYKPDAGRMAYFHALAVQVLEQPTTAYYDQAREYLTGKIGWDAWQNVGLQGLAEIVSRLDQDGNNELLVNAMTQIPSVVRNALLNFLENTQPNQELTTAINDALALTVANEPTAPELAAYVRALSNSENRQQRQLLMLVILQHPLNKSVELLAAIGSRCWRDLSGDLLLTYLECLAKNEQGTPAFNALLADLLTLPNMRVQVMNVLTSPECSSVLKDAFTKLAGEVKRYH